jgi:hypothetical protein
MLGTTHTFQEACLTRFDFVRNMLFMPVPIAEVEK